MKKLHNGFAAPFVLLIVGLIVGAGVVFAYFQFSSKTPASQPNTSQSPIVQSSPAADKTVDWKTLSSEQHGFTLKYPTSYDVTDPAPLPEQEFLAFIKNIQTDSPKGGGGFTVPTVRVKVFESDADTLDAWVKRHTTSQAFDFVDTPLFFYPGVKNTKSSSLGGLKAITFESNSYESIPNPTIAMKGNKIYIVELDNINEQKDPMLKEYYSEIISTFKFTN